MAKRTSNRSQANDATTPSPSKPRRPRAAAAPAADASASSPDFERASENGAMNAAATGAEPASTLTHDAPPALPMRSESGPAEWTVSSSMASEPNEEDIRMRAYQLFVERGAIHGMHFEDWLEAERELRSVK